MKAKIKDKGNFKPIKLEIDIESIEELKDLWHIFNQSSESIKERAFESSFEYPNLGLQHRLWNLINDELKDIENK